MINTFIYYLDIPKYLRGRSTGSFVQKRLISLRNATKLYVNMMNLEAGGLHHQQATTDGPPGSQEKESGG